MPKKEINIISFKTSLSKITLYKKAQKPTTNAILAILEPKIFPIIILDETKILSPGIIFN